MLVMVLAVCFCKILVVNSRFQSLIFVKQHEPKQPHSMQASKIEKKDEESMEVKVAKAPFPPPNRSYSGVNPSLQDLHLHCFRVDAYKLLCEMIERKETH